MRAHSKFSASGSERWLNCAASVALEEKAPPSPDTPWSKEGTLAHECLEQLLTGGETDYFPKQMFKYCEKARDWIKTEARKLRAPLLIEKRVYNNEIHPEMFGTCDAIIPQYMGTLHIIDFKYGAGHLVSPIKNTQMIQYALAVAEAYDWKFERVKMTIIQPRAGNKFSESWEISITELKNQWLPLWKKGVARVERGDAKPFPGSWCHWCRAKTTCPAKNESRVNAIEQKFGKVSNGKKEENKKSYPKKGATQKVDFEDFETLEGDADEINDTFH